MPCTPIIKKKKVQTRQRNEIIYDRMDNAHNLLKQRSVPKATTERSESAIYGE